MNVALAQINPTVGDLEGNKDKIRTQILQARSQGAELVVFPELALTGYPPKDLLSKKSFVQRNKEVLQSLIPHTIGVAAVIGFVDEKDDVLYNAAAIMENGNLIGVYHKQHLPNYDVFDEKRYFTAGEGNGVYMIGGKRVGITICEDVWVDGPVEAIAGEVDYVINISASPFHAGKAGVREKLISERARVNRVPIVYLNLVGAQDDLVFDVEGRKMVQAQAFTEDFIVANMNELHPVVHEENVIEDMHAALVLGVRDYFHKNGFSKAILGLSGGIDSALTAAIAVEALGKDNVVGISMPSKFSSTGSVDDSTALAQNLGIPCHVVAIKDVYESYLSTLDPHFQGTEFNVAEENIQARIRGNLLMAMSNKFGYLVLATGNKSELSVGYATLYGDMAGGLAVISDVLKQDVYRMCQHINETAGREVVPTTIIEKEPSAELREDQKDSDSLPPYEILDAILKGYVEEDKSREEIVAQGHDSSTVSRVIHMVDRNEYKRQQAALGLKITHRAFGSGRRMPIVNKWRGQ